MPKRAWPGLESRGAYQACPAAAPSPHPLQRVCLRACHAAAKTRSRMTAQLLAIIAPILIASALGFGWARMGLGFDADFIRRFVFYIGGPALIVSSLTSSQVEAESLLQVGGVAAAVWALSVLVALTVLRAMGRPLPVYLPPLVFGNQANMGVPLCMFAFGDTGLVLGVAYFVTINLLHFTVGLYIVSHRNPIREILQAPMLYATVLSVGLLAAGTDLPDWLANSVRLLGQATIPLMLLTLGSSLSKLGLRGLGSASWFGAARIGLGFSAGLIAVALLDLHGPLRGVVLLQASMPAAIFNYLFALQFNRSPEVSAGIIVSSTALSFLSLPALVWFALQG